MSKPKKSTKEEFPCTHCDGGKKVFKTIAQHPKGAGIVVPCSRCHGTNEEPFWARVREQQA